MKIEDKVQCGEFVWRVLEVQNDAALIIPEKIIEQRSYHSKPVEITWEGSFRREYLNTELHDRYSESEKASIAPVVNKNPDNPWHGTVGGHDAEEKILFPVLKKSRADTLATAARCCSIQRRTSGTGYERKDANNSKRIAVDEEKTSGGIGYACPDVST